MTAARRLSTCDCDHACTERGVGESAAERAALATAVRARAAWRRVSRTRTSSGVALRLGTGRGTGLGLGEGGNTATGRGRFRELLAPAEADGGALRVE